MVLTLKDALGILIAALGGAVWGWSVNGRAMPLAPVRGLQGYEPSVFSVYWRGWRVGYGQTAYRFLPPYSSLAVPG